MIRQEVSKISCAVDANVASLVDEALDDLSIPEVFIQRGKQMILVDRSSWMSLRSSTAMEENRAWIYRFCVPPRFEAGVLRRIAEAADLLLPGRGSAYAEPAVLIRREALAFDEDRLSSLSADKDGIPSEGRHESLCCIVQRGMAETLCRTILEMGLCVPIVSFGEGMGLRNKLGLLRVTIPVEKEVLYFIVPSHDADLLEHIAVHKARLDRPGQGFIYRTIIRAMAVNLKVRRGKPSSAASMEQIIAALDDIRGSSEWRRVSSARSHGVSHKKDTGELVSLSLTAEEGRVSDFVRAAMSVGAGGATLLPLEFRSYGKASPSSRVSHARESCDLIIPKGIQEAVLNTVDALGLFSAQVSGFAELTGVSRAVTYTG